MKRRTNARRRGRAALAAAVATAGLAIPSVADAAPVNSNLVQNPGFETVDLASTGEYNGPQILVWSGLDGLREFAYSHDGSSSSAGVVPDYADGTDPPNAGHWYFSSNNAVGNVGPGQFFQDIDVSQGPSGALIASGAARFNLSAFMSSYLNDNDYGNIGLDFRNAAGASLGSVQLDDSDPGPDNVWNENVLTGAVPVGTATVRLSVFGTPVNGGQDGYIDNVDFRVVPEPSGVVVAGAGVLGVGLTRNRRGPRDAP